MTFATLITIEPIDLARGSEVFDLFSRYRFRGVIHAAQAHQRAQTRTANRANYDMAFNCLEAAEASGVNRFLLVSSIIVYAGLGPPLSEDKRVPRAGGGSTKVPTRCSACPARRAAGSSRHRRSRSQSNAPWRA